MIRFHGGCHGCSQPLNQDGGYDFCYDCRFFDANWDLPNFNNKPPTEADLLRFEIKLRKEDENIK
jgi:hypothetical protein